MKCLQNRRYLNFPVGGGGGGEAYRLWSAPRGAYNNWKHLKLWESGLFSGYYIWIKCHQNLRYLNFPGGQKPPIKGSYMWPAMPIFELGLAIPVKSHVWKFGSDWLSLSRVIWIFRGGRNPYIKGVACDLQCPFSDLAELFQSKVICVNLVRIVWAFQELTCPQTFFFGAETPY